MNDTIMHIKGLTKHYGKVKALNDLNLTIKRGEIFGYLGPNGAGKTTTIRTLLDFIRPTTGTTEIFGMDTHKQSVDVHARTGYLAGELSLWNHLNGWELVDYVGGLRGGMDKAYIQQLVQRLDIDMSRKIKNCSSGMKRKIGLITAMMHKPDLLILDEPTTGLDPLVQQTFHKLMHEVREEGRTVFLSSHNLPEVEAICDRVGILSAGKLQAVESISELKRMRFHWMTLRFSEHTNPSEFEKLAGIEDVNNTDNQLRFRVTGELDPVIKEAAKHHVIDMTYEEPSLEEIFLEYYGDKEKR